MTKGLDVKSISSLGLFRRLWRHLNMRRRRQLVLLVATMIASAFAEVVSLGAVLPFLGVLVSPDRVFQQPAVATVALAFGITSASELVLPLTLLFVSAAIAAGGIRLLVLWGSTRLSFAVGTDLGISMYRRTLYQPYRVHLARNSSEIISSVTNNTGTVAARILLPLLLLVSSLVVLASIVFVLVAIDPVVAVVSATGLGISYGLITLISRNRLRSNSLRIVRAQTQLLKALQEGLGGVREVLLDGTQEFYCDTYRRADLAFRGAQASNTLISVSPRPAMEALAMILLAVLAYSMSTRQGGIGVVLPTLGALVFGAQRLVPALQQVYASWTTIVGNNASLFDALALLDQPLPPESLKSSSEPLPFRTAIRFEDVCFRYADTGPWIIDGMSLAIPRGSRVGFVGATGSGKSTVMDLLMGLLEPTAGWIVVDDMPIRGTHLRSWQRNIAHVPQSVYLADATLAENIAFGIPAEQIDMPRVKEAARRAQIADFIESTSEGYQALVGERGVRLSGGQRQRIGIARALYKKATVLVFDEATSALDTATERAVMDAIDSLDRNLTILLIAHRVTTLQRCDRIIELKDGRMAMEGSYEQMVSERQGCVR